MIVHNARTNQLDFEWPWSKVKVTRCQKVKTVFLANNPFKIAAESRQKNYNLAYSVLWIILNMIMAV